MPAVLDLTRERDAHIDQRLRENVMVWLSTTRLDGRPHSVPVWFLWDGATILIFSKPDQKVRNLGHNGAVMLCLDDTHNGQDVVMLEGTAALERDPDVTTALHAYETKYGELLTAMGWTGASMAAKYNVAIRVTPTRVI